MSKVNFTKSHLRDGLKGATGAKLREHARTQYEQARDITKAQQDYWDDNGATPAQMMRMVERQRAQLQEQRRALEARLGSLKSRVN